MSSDDTAAANKMCIKHAAYNLGCANAPQVRPPAVEATRPSSIPSLGSLGCGTGDFPQRGAGECVCVCIGVCVRARACVIHGRRVLGLPGSPSALSAGSVWVPN